MASIPSQVYRFNRTFSGPDTLAFILLPGCSPVVLGTITTISYSMFRNKKPVINIGRTNINGVTRGSRIFAGTMVFTVINQHWLREVIAQDTCKDWLGQVPELKVDELPLFDIMLISANEYGAYCSMFIYGIDVTDEAQTLSLEDMFTENTFQFVARDISTFESKDVLYNKANKSSNKDTNPFRISSSKLFFDEGVEYNETDRQKVLDKTKYENEQKKKERVVLTRDLYENTSRYFVGNDVLEVQMLLNNARIKVNETGVFDHETANAVREFQSKIGENVIDGVVTTRLYQALLNYTDNNVNRTRGYVINKAGAYEYKERDMWSDVQNIYPYKETIELSDPDTGDDGNLYYKTENGYVLGTDVFNVDNVHSTVELPTLKYNDSSAYVTKVQEAINDIYGTSIHTGKMDNLTMDYIRALQGSYDLPKTGIVDNDTWIALQTASGKTNIVSNDDVEVTFSMAPGVYDSEDIKDAIKALEVSVKTENGINVKTVATSKYSDNTFNYNENLEEVIGSKKLDKTNLSNATLYNAYKGELPQVIEYTVYPYNMDPYKWVFKSKGA